MIALANIQRKDEGVDDVPVYSVREFLDTFNADAALSRIVYSCKNSRSTKAVEYINIPCAFDTEWTTVPMPEDPDKYFSTMYVWSFCLGYRVVAGRTWEEFETLLRELKLRLLLHFNRILRIYVHNLSAEWQFLHYRLPTKKLFSREVRQPIEWKLAGQYEGIEFRCSYILTNNSLASWAADEPLCPYGKQVGELDYSIVRTRSTPLTEREWGYIAADVLTMNYCIAAMIGREWRRGIDSLPLTKTGFVRRAMRRKFAKIPEWQRYEQRVRLTAEQFILYYQGLRGGDTHSQIVNTGIVWPDVWSFDITSSYPYQMIAREFPSSAAVYLKEPSISEFNVVLSEPGWLWIAKMRLVDLRLKDPTYYATIPLSLTTAHDPGGKKNPDGIRYKYKRGEKREIIGDELRLDNGRIVYAKEVEIPLYSTDFWIMNENYTFKVKEITEMLFHPKKALLPKCFRDFILDLYQKKTTLKGVTDDEQPGAENLYRLSKENINSAFGATITNPLNNVIDFDLDKHEWHLDPLLVVGSNREKIQAELDKVYRSRNHFLPYSIGGWVAAYGRLQLYEALRELHPYSSAVYWDTDSVYFNDHRGVEVFEKLNEGIAKQLLSIYNEDEIAPKDKKGIRHMIGLWDPQFGGKSVRFITFGSKKYFYQENEKPHVNHITVAGLNKKKGAEYLTQLAGGEIINGKPCGGAFCETVDLGFKWPEEWSGRTVAQYSEEEYTMTINGDVCTEQSWLAILPTTYELGETSMYKLERLLAADYVIRER